VAEGVAAFSGERRGTAELKLLNNSAINSIQVLHSTEYFKHSRILQFKFCYASIGPYW